MWTILILDACITNYPSIIQCVPGAVGCLPVSDADTLSSEQCAVRRNLGRTRDWSYSFHSARRNRCREPQRGEKSQVLHTNGTERLDGYATYSSTPNAVLIFPSSWNLLSDALQASIEAVLYWKFCSDPARTVLLVTRCHMQVSSLCFVLVRDCNPRIPNFGIPAFFPILGSENWPGIVISSSHRSTSC
jgi:hypothetical protein